MARPSSYNTETAEKICELLASGMSLRKICELDGFPERPTVFRWLFQQPEFRNQYAVAREAWADAEFDTIFDIADDGSNDTYIDEKGNKKTDWDVVGRSKLRIDTRRWALARMSPRKYGEKTTTELTGPNGTPLFDDKQREKRLAALATRIAQRNAQPKADNDVDDLV